VPCKAFHASIFILLGIFNFQSIFHTGFCEDGPSSFVRVWRVEIVGLIEHHLESILGPIMSLLLPWAIPLLATSLLSLAATGFRLGLCYCSHMLQAISLAREIFPSLVLVVVPKILARRVSW
jgi:hypothetical protein